MLELGRLPVSDSGNYYVTSFAAFSKLPQGKRFICLLALAWVDL